MNSATSQILSQQYLPAQIQQMILNQQNQNQSQLQQLQATLVAIQQKHMQQQSEPHSPDVQSLNNAINKQINGSATDNTKNISNFGTPLYFNSLQAKGSQSQQTEQIRNKTSQEQGQGSGFLSQASTIPQFSIGSDNQISSSTQINHSSTNIGNPSQDCRNGIQSGLQFNGSLPTVESIDSQQNLGNQILNQGSSNSLLANLNGVNANQQFCMQNVAGSFNQNIMNQQQQQQQQLFQNLQALQAQQSSLLSSTQFPNTNASNNIMNSSNQQNAMLQAENSKSQQESLFNQQLIASQLHKGNPNQLIQLFTPQQLQLQQYLLMQNSLLSNQQELLPQQKLLQQLYLQQQSQINNPYNSHLIASHNLATILNHQPCLVEEVEEEEEQEVVDIPPVKDEHLSMDEEENIAANSKTIKQIPVIPQGIGQGQISATLFDKSRIIVNQSLLDKQTLPTQFTSLQKPNQQIPFPTLSRRNTMPENTEISDEDEDEESGVADRENEESEIQQIRRRQEQQQKLFKTLNKVYQMQINTPRIQDGEFQSPATPQEQKHQRYINPLRLEYQKLVFENTNHIKGIEKIKQAIILTDQQILFSPLPRNYKSTFSENLIYLVESINKDSIIRKNPHLLYGSISTTGRPQSCSISSQATTRFFETPGMHPQAKIEEHTHQYLNDNFSLNGGFSLRNSLKKIENSNVPSNNLFLQKNVSQQDDEISSDSFGQNIDVNPIRGRQISNISGFSANGQSPSQFRSHKQSFTTNFPNTPILNSSPSQNQTQAQERTLLNLYSSNFAKDKDRSKQFATAKNTQGNRARGISEASLVNPSSPTASPSPAGLQKRSKYHNLTKLFMYFLLSLFQHDNMERLGVPDHIQQELIKCVQNVKKTAKKKIKNKNLQKTDFFNHTHYNALFLHLNKNSLRELQKKEKDILVHKQCYGLDLSEIDLQRLEYVNILKKFAYEIVINTLEAPSESECENNPRNEYMLKALSGIRQLAQGNVIFRFQQVYGPQSSQDD